MPPTIDRHIPDLVTLEEAGRLLGISRQGVHKMAMAGHLPVKRVGSTWVARRVVVQRLADKSQDTTSPNVEGQA